MSERQGYPVVWKDRKLIATDLTDDLKWKYTVWLFNDMLDNAAKRMSRNAYNQFEKKLTVNPPEWTSVPDDTVVASFTKLVAWRQLMRLILDLPTLEEDPLNGMSDDELAEMIASKEPQEGKPQSDLTRAMNRIQDAADPKVQKGGPGSPRPEAEKEPTPPSATSQSA